MLTLSRNAAFALFGAASLAALSVATVAHAEDAPTPDKSASSQSSVGEIVVYAQRKAESLQKVPVAVTVMSGSDLEVRKLNDLTQITIAAPSFQITTDNAFTLRGIGSQIWNAQVDSSVGVSVDDVSLGVPLFMSNGIFDDISQVAVLDGPQGLLFGRNASAGLLQIVSNKPVLGQTSGDASFEYDNRDSDPGGHLGLVGKATLNVPVSSNSALRMNVLGSFQNPVVDYKINTSPDAQLNQTRLGGKIKYLWEPASDTSVYVIGDYSRERGTGGIWDRTFRVDASGGRNFSANGDALAGCVAGPKNLCASVDGPNFRSVDTYGASVNVSHKVSPILTISDIAAVRQYKMHLFLDSDYSALNYINLNTTHETYRQFSNEFRVAMNTEKIDGQFGLYWFDSILNSNAQVGLTAGGPLFVPSYFLGGDHNTRTTADSFAAFGQFNYHATDALRLTAGGRETRDKISANITETQLNYVIPLSGPRGNFLYNATNSNFSYKVGAEYDVAPGAMLYANWSTGYKGASYAPAVQGGTAIAPISPYIAPETVKDLEVGIKAYFFDHKLRFNLSGFTEKFTNFQTQTWYPSQSVFILANAGGVKSTGFEINASARPTSQFTLNFGATYTDAKFTDFLTSCYTGQPGCNAQGVVQVAGYAPPTAARLTSTLEGLYDIPLGANKLTLEANWYHRSSLNFSPNGDPQTQLGANNVFGVSAIYKLGENAKFSVFCKNCTNNYVPTYITHEPADAGIIQSWDYNSVRTIGLSVDLKF